MQLTFCLFHYFPFGGLQRDFMRIMQLCQQKGHRITVYTMNWTGDQPPGITITILPVSGHTHTQRIRSFIGKLKQALNETRSDLVIGFNRMPGLDLYFASDICFAEKTAKKAFGLLRFLPRYRFYLKMENAVFGITQKTHCLVLTEQQRSSYQQYYQTPKSRLTQLPPGLNENWRYPDDANELRLSLRQQYRVSDQDLMLLSVGSHFSTKGIARSLVALAKLPESLRQRSRLFVMGKGNQSVYLKQAKSLDIEKNVFFLGVNDNVMPWMLSADLLLHPARYESAGMVLLEALALGLPIIATDTCGYASYIKEANAGIVLSSPFSQINYNQTLSNALNAKLLLQWKQNALTYTKTHKLSGLTETAVEWIEMLGKQKVSL